MRCRRHSGLPLARTQLPLDWLIGVAEDDSRVPDLIGIAKQGTVYASGKLAKIAKAVNAAQDRHVGLVVSGGGIRHNVVTDPVETTQLAPTILKLSGLEP